MEVEDLHEGNPHTGPSHLQGLMSPYHLAYEQRPRIDLETHTILEVEGHPPRSLCRPYSLDPRESRHIG